MNTKIKQNKNTFAIRVSSICIALFFLFSFFCSLAFATDLNSDYIIVSTDSDNPTAIVSYTNNDGSGYGTIYTESETTVYVCTYGNFYTGYRNNTSSGQTTRGFIVFSTSPFTVQWQHGLADFSESSSSYGDFYIIDDYIALNPGQSISVNASLPYFNTKSEALTAIDSFLDNPPSPGALTGEFTYSLPAGNVIFIDVTNLNVSVDLSQTTPEY